MRFLRSIPKEKLQKIVLVVVIGITILGATINFYVLKQFEKISAKRQVIADLTSKVDASEANARSEASNAPLREKMKEFVQHQQQRMLTGDPFSWAVREISLLGEKHPVRIGGLGPGVSLPFADKPQYSLFTVRLDVDGTYDQLGKFVSDLENSFPTSRIQSLTMTGASSGNGDCHVAIEMALLVAPQETKSANEVKKKT